MTHTNEDLLTLAERLDGIEIYSVREHLVGFGTRPIEAANNAVCEAAAALRAIVAERDRLRAALDDALVACRIVDAVARAGHEKIGDLVLHMLSAVEPARAALKGDSDE